MKGYYFKYNKQLYCLEEIEINRNFGLKLKGERCINILVGKDMSRIKKQRILHSIINNKDLVDINGKNIKW